MRTTLFILFGIVFLTACKKEAINYDPEAPDLPLYTEKGLGIGGILINDNSWLFIKRGSFSSAQPLQILSYPTGDSIVVLFNGNFKNTTLQNNDQRTIFVVIKNLTISADADLIQLNDRNFVLDGIINYGGFCEYFSQNKIGAAAGQLSFGKVEKISNTTYGTSPPRHPYIVSGKLDMSFSVGTNFYLLTKGRFDVKIINETNSFRIY